MAIIENSEEYLTDFIRLNEEWINNYFSIEAADKELALNPGKIITDGGYIFSLVNNNTVVGVCALFNLEDGNYELARMAVSPLYQGNGLGDKLMQICLEKLRHIRAKKVHLLSNTRLTAAISLYKKYGFTTVTEGQHPVYSRANIVMELKLS